MVEQNKKKKTEKKNNSEDVEMIKKEITTQVEDNEKKKKKNSNEGNGEKKGDEGVVELKVDMHCDGCAESLKKYIKKNIIKGVDRVSVHESNTKLKVIGNVDPWKLKEVVEAKCRREVTFISPKNPPKKKEKGGADDNKGIDKAGDDGDGKDGQKKTDEKKAKQPVVSTVGFKMRLHCDGCIDRIKKYTGKFKGVDGITIEASKDLVTVKGTMDTKALLEMLKDKLKRDIEIVQLKKDEKKEKNDDKKQKDNNGNKEKKNGGGEKISIIPPSMLVDANRMDYYGGGYFYQTGYHMNLVPAPQLFSDENPNACSIM